MKKKSWGFHAGHPVAGRPLLPAGSAQRCLAGQLQGLGLCRAGVARPGALRPVAHCVPGEALHRAAAGRRGRPDPPPARHHRDLLDREAPPSACSSSSCLQPLHAPTSHLQVTEACVEVANRIAQSKNPTPGPEGRPTVEELKEGLQRQRIRNVVTAR